jgi:hypothetical protein
MATQNIYYRERMQAPYLAEGNEEHLLAEVSTDNITPAPSRSALNPAVVTTSTPGSVPRGEGDATGGGIARRVGSFRMLPRSLSTDALRAAAASSHQSSRIRNTTTTGTPPYRTPKFQWFAEDDDDRDASNVKPNWRLTDRTRTVGIGLVLALNLGMDPPDVVDKPQPCAVLHTWIDPNAERAATAREKIGERLEQQYSKWQTASTAWPLRKRRTVDPTMEDVRSLCQHLRRHARNERVLFHYHGHGVPRPTHNGEIWAFDAKRTEYIALSVADVRTWLGKPSIVVLDCSSAGVLVPFFTAPMADPSVAPSSTPSRAQTEPTNLREQASEWVSDTVVLCPCSEGEWLPMNPDYPVDIFTSCLTTPLKIALRWFIQRNPVSMASLHPDAVDHIPGVFNDRKTPLGELNWIFAAVTDSIAWNVLPKPLFQRLFRHDLLMSSMFRNFLLADRVLRSMGCTPVSYPPLPPGISNHQLWQSWDLACETMLVQLMNDGVLGNHLIESKRNHDAEGRDDIDDDKNVDTAPAPTEKTSRHPTNHTVSVSSPFFSEQLTAFEVWLEFTSIHKMQLKLGMLEPPEPLPMVLQVLLSQTHRIRALHLLRRFLEFGPWAVNLSLILGIFPYVSKLLQSPDYKSLLVGIWASILAFDPSCRVDMLKNGILHHFVQYLTLDPDASGSVKEAKAARERTLAAFDLSITCYGYPMGQSECVRLRLHNHFCALFSAYEKTEKCQDDDMELYLPAHFRLWLCICIANMMKDNNATQAEAYNAGVHSRLFVRMSDQDPDVRAAVCYALGCLLGTSAKNEQTGKSHSLPIQNNPGQYRVPFQSTPALNPQQHQQSVPATTVPGALKPTFISQGGTSSLQWRPRQLHSVQGVPFPGQPMAPLHGQYFTVQPGAGLNQQPMQMQSQNVQEMQPQYMVQGQTPNPSPNVNRPSGFLTGGGLMNPQAKQPLLDADTFQNRPILEQRQLSPSVYEDHQRLDLDLLTIEVLLKAVEDASVVVRYEATLGLARAVGKYLDAFVSVASTAASNEDRNMYVSLPPAVDLKTGDRFALVWSVLRLLQHNDPFPFIAKAANDIVCVVFEHLLRRRLTTSDRDDKGRQSLALRAEKLASNLTGIEEEQDSDGIAGHSIDSTPPLSEAPTRQPSAVMQKSPQADLRRVASESITGRNTAHSMEQNALDMNLSGVLKEDMVKGGPVHYILPKSQFFEWKRDSFDINFESVDDDTPADTDPLSPEGAAKIYLERRNFSVRENARKLSDRYALLAPKLSGPKGKSIEEMLYEQESEDALLAVEEEATLKKGELELQEKMLLRNEGVKMTSMVRFHAYEDVLMACGASDAVSMWCTNSGKQLTKFLNSKTKKARLTTSAWINEHASSLFMVGGDTGNVHVWGNLLESNGEACRTPAKLISAFQAAPMTAGQRGSGLICEWQSYSGTLLAGGSSKTLRCWDLESEKLSNQFETNTDANLTTLTTAWDYDELGMGPGPKGYQGIGQDIVVGGFSDGALRIFDIRTNQAGSSLQSSQPTRPRRKRATEFSEHKTWVVSTSFTAYGNRYELISGTISGEIKIWDLRMSSSIRTFAAQRSTMTSFAVHSKIPILATGSHAQFIKLLTLDGDAFQVMRYHGKMASHRIGPVSCLAFHRFKPMLAAGATDAYIGLYTTKKRVI